MSDRPLSKPKRRRQGGNSLTEYLIIAGLVVITALGVITLFGKDIKRMFGSQPSKGAPAKVETQTPPAAMGATGTPAPAGMTGQPVRPAPAPSTP